ncbi:hypothetical protein KM043_002806 [Ampulex compressa]|nr:hypothetical protein KM043_002806 [Ampulex compressa]
MGATGSSNTVPTSPLPTSHRSGRANDDTSTNFYGNEEPYCPERANENTRQRTATRVGTLDVGEEPRSQGPSPYPTLKPDEPWNRRPTAPSLTNLASSRRETLLTYATQMTGWQTAEGHGPSFPQQHQAMELSRIISQLAVANQQLATAHNATLAHVEALYAELRRERASSRRAASSTDLETVVEPLKKRLTDDYEEGNDEREDRWRLEYRIGKLESLLARNIDGHHHRQRNPRREEERQLRFRIERLENLAGSRESGCENEITLGAELCGGLGEDRRGVEMDLEVQERRSAEPLPFVINNRFADSSDVPESGMKWQKPRGQAGAANEDGRARSIHRIHSIHSDVVEVNSLGMIEDASCSNVNLHLERVGGERMGVEAEGQSGARNVTKDEVVKLTEEIERLEAERSEYKNTNERLLENLAEQKAMVDKLGRDYEESQCGYRVLEDSLNRQREQYDELLGKFDVATKETERLLKELDAFHLEKHTAEARISSLEQDLQKSVLEKEQIRNAETQKNSKLRAQLSQEVSDKKKQIKALEDALDEIQRLKETIKTETANSDDCVTKEDSGSGESMDDTQCSPATNRASNMDEFKKELTLKREARQRAIAAISSEMEQLKKELDAEKEAHSETSRILDLLRSAQTASQAEPPSHSYVSTCDGTSRKIQSKDQKEDEHEIRLKKMEAQRLTSILKVSDELKSDIRLQMEKVDDVRYQLETDPERHRYRIRCLADVTSKTREALFARERKVNELKDQLAQILVRLGDRSFLELHDNVGAECERQLENITSLKGLYNERLKVLNELKDAAVKELADVKERLEHSLKKCECLEDDLKKADEKIDVQDTEISNLESQLGLTKADCRDLQNQMSLINGLFTQMLLGASSADMDLDRLTQLLQENHDLISDMAREEGTEAAALPKLLLDLVEQVEGRKNVQKRIGGEDNAGAEAEVEKKEDDLQQEDIAHNLPKVWRVLLELLSCHAVGTPTVSAVSCSDPNSCYKSVDTPAGPRLVISVSKTYIRLKELILEKKHLEKEMNRMKQLNAHLESKLGEQEKRLSTVSDELSKTWNIVGRMQAQHQQLHTHEKILRYELQQKRKMLQELKQELEYCREKWESARQKNTNTELEWRSLRREFAARKALAAHDSFNNSAESGFSDERGDDTDEEDDAVEGRIRLGPRRRTRKESPRAPTPDTESEQPTDTELSEPKTGSSATLEQRTPTPETEAELDEIEIAGVNSECPNAAQVTRNSRLNSESSQESLDPLDQALTNVIQNLIEADGVAELERIPIHDYSMDGASNLEEITDELLSDKEAAQDSTARHDLTAEFPIAETDATQSCISPSTECSTNLKDFEKEAEEATSGVEESREASTTDVFGTIASSLEESLDIGSCTTPVPSSSPSPSPLGNRDAETKPLADRGTSRSLESVADSDTVSVDSSSSLETVKEFSTAELVPPASPSRLLEEARKPEASAEASSSSVRKEETRSTPRRIRTPEEALAARADRLKRLEEQADWLMKKMSATSRRGSALSTRLEELHEAYGEPPAPPPMPDVLPSCRLRTNLNDLTRQVPESSAENTESVEAPVSKRKSASPPPKDAP